MEIKDIELMVFDMAGTTINEGNVVYKTLQEALETNGYPVDLSTVLQMGAGKEKHQAILDILNTLKIEEDLQYVAKLIFREFKKRLNDAYTNLTIDTYPGVASLFKKLHQKNIKIVLNTGYDRVTAESLLKKLRWEVKKDIDGLVTASDVVHGRPQPDMIFKAMEYFDITDASKVLKAGDSRIDIREGKNACCGITIAVLSGAQSREQLENENPTYILNHLGELEALL